MAQTINKNLGSDYQRLINQLEQFIKKFYINQIIRGIAITFISMAVLSIIAFAIEYFVYFSSTVRQFILYGILALNFGFFVFLIVVPITKLLKLNKSITYQQAADIITKHFGNIQDKLRNILQLAQQANSHENNDLLLASIQQKAEQLKVFYFPAAINFKVNLKYLKIILAIFIVVISISFISPDILTDGSQRILNPTQHFEKAAPYQFKIITDSLSVLKGEDFELLVTTEGNFVPERVYIQYGANDFLMQTTENPNVFKYAFRAVNNAFKFRIKSEIVSSKEFHVQVIPVPIITNSTLQVTPPAYTGIPAETYTNTTDIRVPYGSVCRWIFKANQTNTIYFKNDSSNWQFQQHEELFSFKKQFYSNALLQLNLKNQYLTKQNLINYTVEIIPDLYPAIQVQQKSDTSSQTLFFFKGELQDDYGFSKLNFVVEQQSESQTKPTRTTKTIFVEKKIKQQSFFYQINLDSFVTDNVKMLSYYFEISDNDPFKGGKRTKSEIFSFKIPSLQDLQELNNTQNQTIKEKIDETQKLANELIQEVNDLKKKLVSENLTNWEKQKLVNSITDKQKSLEQLLQEIAQQNNEKDKTNSSFSKQQLEIIKKQEQLQSLLENVMDDEMKKLMEEIQKLRNEMNDKKLLEMTEKLDQSYEDLSKELDRNLELLKQMEVEQNVNRTAQRLDKLAEDHQKLANELKNAKTDEQKLKMKQQLNEQEKELFDLQKNYNQTQDKNKELKSPFELKEFQEEFDQINQQFEQSLEQLNNSKENKSSQSMKNNAQKMKKLAQEMNQMMAQNQMQMNQINTDNLKQIIENLLSFSFQQEELILTAKAIRANDPSFTDLMKKQHQISEDFKLIEDSLIALSTQVPQLNAPIFKETKSINSDLATTTENLAERRIGRARITQQLIMTSANNLALLLSEVMEQMEQNQKNQSGKSGDSKGKPKPSAGDMKAKQEQIKKQMQQMLDKMKQGMKKGQMTKDFAKTLAEQEKLEKMLNDLMKEGTISPEQQHKLNQVRKMIDENKKDLYNQNLTQESINRNQRILTRLLEIEKAQKEREQDKKRKSEEATIKPPPNFKKLFEVETEKNTFKETLEYNQIKLNQYYKQKYNEYLNIQK